MNNTVNNFIQFVKRFPTGDNCQCWNFSSHENIITITHDDVRAEHSFNSSNAASLLSLGFLLEYIEGAKSALKIDCDIQVNGLDIEVTILSKSSIDHISPDNAYLTRKTDRRTYSSSLNTDEVTELQKKFTQIKVINYNNLSAGLKKILLVREKFLWLNHKFYYDFIKWVRFSKADYEKSKDGMRPEHLQVTPDVTCLLWIFKHFPLALKIFISTPLYIPLKLTTQGFYKKSHLIVVEAQDYSESAIVDAGKQAMRIWIDQEEKGHSLQPMNIQLIPYVDKIRVKEELEYNQSMVDSFSKDFNTGKFPVWVFRVGKNKKKYNRELTLRA